MKITVVGTINRDIVRLANGNLMESLGGALYTILTLASLSPKQWEITPIANVGRDIFESVMSILRMHENVNTTGINRTDCDNNTVYLRLTPNGGRDEHTDLNLPPISFEQIEPHLDCQALMLNFTSGFDLKLETAVKILKKKPGIIYLDIHSLTLSIDQRKHRRPRKIPRWRRWITGADFVQLTTDEAWSLHKEDEFSEMESLKVGREIARIVNRACLMTRGAKGLTVYTPENEYQVNAEAIDEPVDPTGCGDVFGASFLLEYLKNRDILASAHRANRLAAVKCKFAGINAVAALINPD